jgi:histone H2A
MNNSTGQTTDTIVESSTGRANASFTRNKKISKSKKSGVLFPVSRLHRFLRRSSPKNRVSVSASIYIAAVMEYLCAEVLELSGNAARDNRRTRVTPRHIFLAVTIDEELKKVFFLLFLHAL